MEKIILPLWRPAENAADDFRDALLTLASAVLSDLPGIRAGRLAVVDTAVTPAESKRMASSGELPSAMLSRACCRPKVAEEQATFISNAKPSMPRALWISTAMAG